MAISCGCGSGLTGGSLPPGEPDVEGYVLATPDTSGMLMLATAAGAASSIAPAQQWPPAGTPIPDCDVQPFRAGQLIASTRTGEDGRFEFTRVATGEYDLLVVPPQGSGYSPNTLRFRHRYGQQTRLVVYLEREAAL